MKLGFLTAPFPDTDLMTVADWAAASGFEVLEIACWPRSSGATRKYAGTSHIDVADLSEGQATEIVEEVAANRLTISGLGYYPNPLHPDREVREAAIAHQKLVIEACAKMGVPLFNTFMGGDSALHVDANWERALEIWPPIVAHARAHGVKITIENHWGLSANPMNVRIILDEVNHPFCEATPDFCNWEHEYMLYHGLEALAPYAHTTVHAKYWNRWKEVDVQRCVRIMTNAKFKGIFALEYEDGPWDGVEGARYLLKEVMAAL